MQYCAQRSYASIVSDACAYIAWANADSGGMVENVEQSWTFSSNVHLWIAVQPPGCADMHIAGQEADADALRR